MSGSVDAREVPAADRSVILRRHEDVAEIVLHRPHKLNAMNMTWINDLLEIVSAIARDKPGLVVIRGEGRAFCAGLDLDMFAAEGMPPRSTRDRSRRLPHWSAWTGWSSRRFTAIASGAACSLRWRATSA